MRFHYHHPCSELFHGFGHCYPKLFSFSHGSSSRRSPWDEHSGPHRDPLVLGCCRCGLWCLDWLCKQHCFISGNTLSWWFCTNLGKLFLRPVCFLKWAIFLLCCSSPNLLSFYSFHKFLQHYNQKCKITKSTYAGLKIEQKSNSC